MEAILTSQAKKSAYLTKDNEKDWKDIPGSNDILIAWNQYFYNCTNAWDVTYKNAKPEFMEFGPYVYRESDTYSDLVYQDLDNLVSGEALPSVQNTFVQGVTYDDDIADGDDHLDTKMFLTNQALYGVWYQQNAAQAPDQVWRVYLTVLYSAIVDGLGREVIDQGIWSQIRSSKFGKEKKINNNFVSDYPVTPE